MHTRLSAVVLLASAVSLAAEAPPTTLTLDQALSELDSRNLTLAQAKARAGEARGVSRQALAGLLPTLGVGGSYVRNNEGFSLDLQGAFGKLGAGLSQALGRPITIDTSSLPAKATLQPLEAFTGQATLRLPLFAANGYQDYLSASEAALAAEQSAEGARLQLRAALLQAAAWAQATEDIATATEAALAVARSHQESADRRFEAGTAERLSTLQARTDVVRRESDLVRARADRARAWLALGILLGRAEPVRVTVPEAAPAAAGPEVQVQLERALSVRPELKAQGALQASAEAQVRSAWWRLLPQLSGSLSGQLSDVAFVTGQNYAWRAGVDLTWTLYDGGFRYGKRTQAESQLLGTRAALQAQRLEVQQQVLDARRDVEVAQERLRLAGKQRDLAVEAAATARRGFEAGLASSLDVLDANDRLYQADVGQADARARLGMASAALGRATGELLP